jgi:hypothetical protein
MYIRGELALQLLYEGFTKRCVIPFLNHEQSSGWWIRHRGELKALFLEYVTSNDVEVAMKLRHNGFRLLLCRKLIEAQYKLYTIRGRFSYE